MPKDILSVHKQILKEDRKKLVQEIKEQAPVIQKEHMISEFLKTVNGFNLKERSNLAWRIFWGKL